MLGVMFDNYHSHHDLGMWLKKYPAISPPTPKIKMVDVPGADGSVDMTRALTGYVQYNRRTITMEFVIAAPRSMWPDVRADIMDKLHGQEMNIVMDDDDEYFYTGRLTVSGFDPQKVTDTVTVTADVEPYKTRLEATCMTYTISGILPVTIQGGAKPVIPTITASTSMKMVYGGVTYNLEEGENTIPDIIIRRGSNAFTFEGSGTIILAYREGRF